MLDFIQPHSNALSMILALKNEDLFVIPIDEVCAQIVRAISQAILDVIVGYRGRVAL